MARDPEVPFGHGDMEITANSMEPGHSLGIMVSIQGWGFVDGAMMLGTIHAQTLDRQYKCNQNNRVFKFEIIGKLAD